MTTPTRTARSTRLRTRAFLRACLCGLLGLWGLAIALPAGAQSTDTELQKILASNAASGDLFGSSVAVDELFAFVGAPLRTSDNGAVYIYEYDGERWTEWAELTPPDNAANGEFGRAVAIDGDVAVVSSLTGLYVYRRDGTQWTFEVKLSLSSLAPVVDVSGNVIVSSRIDGDAFVFRFDGTVWSQEAQLAASDGQSGDQFGISVAVDGDALVVGASGEDDGGTAAGAAYVYRYDGSVWIEEAKLVASDAQTVDRFGGAVDVSGNLAVVGAAGEDGGVGDPLQGAGAAYIFRFDGSQWSQETKLVAAEAQANDDFGTSVAIDGTGVAVGAPGTFNGGGTDAGAAYIYQFNGTQWTQGARLLASDAQPSDRFGERVAVDNNVLFTGATGEDGGAGNPLNSAGAVYVFGPALAAEPPLSATPGTTISVAIRAGSAAFPVPELLGVGFTVQFDPSRLQAVSATAGALLDDGDLVNDSFIDNSAGVVSIGVFRKGSNGPVAGSGLVTSITFQVPTSAPVDVTAAITVADVLGIDGAGAVVPLYPVAGTFDLLDGQTLSVWPGDTDNSGVVDPQAVAVDASDLLPVADCFGLTGPARTGPFDITWGAKSVDPWTFPPADPSEPCVGSGTFTNPAYADATGDGTIDQNDLSAVGLNFGLSRSGATTTTTLAAPTILAVAPELRTPSSGPFETLEIGPLTAGRTYNVQVRLERPINGLRGASMRIQVPAGILDAQAVVPGPVIDDGDVLSLDNFEARTGTLAMAVARKRDAAPVTAAGALVDLQFVAARSTDRPVEVAVASLHVRVQGQGTVGAETSDVKLVSRQEAVGTRPSFSLHPVAPNPAQDRVTLRYDVDEAGPVRLAVYDVLGREVRVLVNAVQTPGSHQAVFAADQVAPGLYLVRLRSGEQTATQKLTVVR